MTYSLQFDGSQNYVDLGKMNGFGGGLGAGFYARFYIKTTGAAAETIGYQQADFRATIGLNQNHVQANVSGALNFYLADLDGVSLVAGTTISTGFNDGSVHLIEVTVSGNTLTIAVDGVSKTITYNVHNTPARFDKFQNDGFMIMGSKTLACTIDSLWLGYTSLNIYAKYLFDEGSGTTAVDSLGNATSGVLNGSPLPLWVAPLPALSAKGSGINLLQVGSADLSLGRTITEQSLPVTIASDQPVTPFAGGGAVANPIIGQYKVTASAVKLAANILTNGVIFTAKSTNTGNIFIGTSNAVTTTADGTGAGYILEPGNSVSAAVTNTNTFWVIGTANDVLSWIGS